MQRVISNFRYTGYSDRSRKEIHSADGETFIQGEHGNWEVHVRGAHILTSFRRQDAREFIREKKKQQLPLPFPLPLS